MMAKGEKTDPWRVAVYVLAIFVTAFTSYFLTNSNKINAEQATTISQTQARLVIADELKDINKHLSDISGDVKALSASLSTYRSNTRVRN